MNISLISILIGLAFIVPGSAQAGILDEAWKVNELNLKSMNSFVCKVILSTGSEEQSNEGKEEEEEPDCD